MTLPTKTIGSLGPVKTDNRAYLRPDSELPAVELEAIKDAVIANAGSRSGPDSRSYFSDLLRADAEWTAGIDGTGVVQHLAANHADIIGSAVGGVHIGASVASDRAAFFHDTAWIDPSAPALFEARVKLPSTIANVDIGIGLLDDDNVTTSAAVFSRSGGVWMPQTISATGASSDSEVTATAMVADAWVVLRVEIDPGVDARFYVDDVLISILSTAAAAPQAGDVLRPDLFVSYAAGADRIVVDWVRARNV